MVAHQSSASRPPREQPLIWPPLNIALPSSAAGPREEKLATYESALRQGAEGIFVNAQLSSQDVPFVVLGGRSNGTQGQPSSPTKRSSPRAPSPLLSEILAWVRSKRCMAVVALHNIRPGAERAVLKEIDRAQVRPLTRVVAHDLPGLQRLRKLDRSVNLAWAVSDRTPELFEAQLLGVEVLLPHWTLASPSFMRQAHSASMLVIPWSVDNPRQMRQTILNGADGIITRHPARLAAALTPIKAYVAPVHPKRPAAPKTARYRTKVEPSVAGPGGNMPSAIVEE